MKDALEYSDRMMEKETIQEAITLRLGHIKTYCEKEKTKRNNELKLYKFHNFVYCTPFKAGTTLFQDYFVNKFVLEDSIPLEQVNSISDKEFREIVKFGGKVQTGDF